MPASVELSVERLLGVLGGVAREMGDPCSVRVCGGRQVEQQRNGHSVCARRVVPLGLRCVWLCACRLISVTVISVVNG